MGYCVGALQIPGYDLPWETDAKGWAYTAKVAPPLQVSVSVSMFFCSYVFSFNRLKSMQAMVQVTMGTSLESLW